MTDRNAAPQLPEMPCCPFCGGAAELGWDTDGSLYLEVWHDQTCPTEGSPDGHSWCRWYYDEDWEGDAASMVSDVAAWWSRRDGIRPEGPEAQCDDGLDTDGRRA